VSKQRAWLVVEQIEPCILLLRGERVILDADLAHLYGTSTKRLNEQVKRNRARFPADFLLQLTVEEKAEVVANCDHLARLKYSPVLPNAFTEHGAIMAASVLNTPRAMDMSVYVVRTFIKLRRLLATHQELAHKLAELERRVGSHDEAIRCQPTESTATTRSHAAADPTKNSNDFARDVPTYKSSRASSGETLSASHRIATRASSPLKRFTVSTRSAFAASWSSMDHDNRNGKGSAVNAL
jgi:hypothetical protein